MHVSVKPVFRESVWPRIVYSFGGGIVPRTRFSVLDGNESEVHFRQVIAETTRKVEFGRCNTRDRIMMAANEMLKLRTLADSLRRDPIVQALSHSAAARGIPAWSVEGGLIQLRYGCKQLRILNGQIDRNSAVGSSIANDRVLWVTALATLFPG